VAKLKPTVDRRSFFLENRRRREIGLACERDAYTTWEIARKLGSQEQPISQMVRTMEAAGALSADRPREQKGRRFTLDPAWVPFLHDAERRANAGVVRPDLDLVIVDTPDLSALWKLLEKPRAREDVAWLTEFRDSRRGAVLAIDRGTEATRALVSALGQRPERIAVGPTTPSHELPRLLEHLHGRYR
jgi:hypothetical protein